MDLTKLKSLEGVTLNEKQMIDLDSSWPRMYLTEPVYLTTRQLAEFFNCTPQRINQYVLDEGLPKVERDKFDLSEAANWYRVRTIAEIFNKKPEEMLGWGVVDFNNLKRTGLPLDQVASITIQTVIDCLPKNIKIDKKKLLKIIEKKLLSS